MVCHLWARWRERGKARSNGPNSTDRSWWREPDFKGNLAAEWRAKRKQNETREIPVPIAAVPIEILALDLDKVFWGWVFFFLHVLQLPLARAKTAHPIMQPSMLICARARKKRLNRDQHKASVAINPLATVFWGGKFEGGRANYQLVII